MMPQFDGTGPSGVGPTGRGRGGCRGFGRRLQTRNGRMFGSMFIAAFGLVAHDARNPDGLTRRSVRSLGNGIRRMLTRRHSRQQVVMPPAENARLTGKDRK